MSVDIESELNLGQDPDQFDQDENQVAATNNDEPQNEPVITTGLLEFLHEDSEGKEILKAYKVSLQKKIPLPKSIRSKLTRVVIRREKDWALKDITVDQILQKFIISSERFEILANEITSIFKYESVATYYTPFIKEGKSLILASGKLWHHYNYVKDCLKEASLLTRRRHANVLTDEPVEDLDDNEDFVWLHSHIEPWNEYLFRWERTFELRRQLLMSNNLSVEEYIDKFPPLKTQGGIELFCSDFLRLYPDEHVVSEEKWKAIKKYLITCLVAEKIKTAEDKVFVQLLKSTTLPDDNQEFLIFYLLCHIIAPKRSGKRKKQCVTPRKLSLEERRETFILVVESETEVQVKVQHLRSKHESFQPVIVAVGDPVNIEKCFVAVNDKLFTVTSIRDAIFLALKIFFTLDCKYPDCSKTIWVFLQKVLLNIDLPVDSLTVDSNVIVGHIKSL